MANEQRPTAQSTDPAHNRGDAHVTLSDGRKLSYRQSGSAEGHPLFALHGTPGSRLKFMVANEIAEKLGIRLIAPDRWGYGATDNHPRPTLSTFARDMATLADRLNIDRFAVMGVSGGGPYAAAVAAELGDRVTALALAAPVGPIAGEADNEITSFHRFCFGAFAHRPTAVAAAFHAFRTVLGISPDLGMRMAMLRTPAADRQMLGRDDVRTRLGATFIEGLKPGVQGPVCDLGLFAKGWGVELEQITAPARLWLGTADQNIPQSAARRLAARIPGCALIELQAEGHMWIADNYATVIGWVAQMQNGAIHGAPSKK